MTKDVVEVARKQRHLHLLEKLRNGETLTAAEVRELDALEHPQSDKVSLSEIAELLGICKSSVWNWVKRGMPKNSDGTYSVAAVRAWVAARDAEKNEASKASDDETEWTVEYRKFKALMAKLDYEKRQGQLVEVAEVDAVNVRKVLALKQRLLMLPRTLGPRLVGLNAEAISLMIEEEIMSAIRDFAEGRA